MIGERCPLCDGPVANGRCTICGMPYKKDEILYHLNENSRDHYKHATEKAREIMRSKAAVSGTDGKSLGKNASAADIRAHQQEVRQEAVKRMTAAKPQTSSEKNRADKKARKKNQKKVESAYGPGKKKTGMGKIILWIIVILLIILPSILNFVEEKADQYFYEKTEDYGISHDIHMLFEDT